MDTSPDKVFIIPYRDRLHHKFFFLRQMSFILEGCTNYEIYFIHQNDKRMFNRGGMKNIGFIAMKEKYPEAYKNITFIFHDVDTLPFNKILKYETEIGLVSHYYGFDTALGGIVAIKGADFEKINGYPNYWGWGMEDACLQKRCLLGGLRIDRSTFYPIGSPEILQLFDGVDRLVCSKDPQRMVSDRGFDGLRTIHKLKWSINSCSSNESDNLFVVPCIKYQYVNVDNFSTAVSVEKDNYYKYDLREPIMNIIHPKSAPTSKQSISVEDWKNVIVKPQHRPRATASAHIGLGGLRR